MAPVAYMEMNDAANATFRGWARCDARRPAAPGANLKRPDRDGAPQRSVRTERNRPDVGRILLILILLVLLGAIGLVGYSYSGLMRPDRTNVVEPVDLGRD